jgi:hypothetical protein
MKTDIFGLVAVCTIVAASFAAPTTSKAVSLFDSGQTSLSSADPTQVGRLSRNAIPQDWANTELFPGVLNPATSYHYQTFAIPITNTPFVQISIDSIATNTFASAYLDTYAPPNLALNWLGDAGVSGNFFGTDPVFFQVIVPIGHALIVVVNETTTNGGLGVNNPFSILVEGFIDTEFTDPSPTPLPAALPLFATGLGALGLLGWRRKKKVAALAA